MADQNKEQRVERPAHERDQEHAVRPGGTVAGRATTWQGGQTSNKRETGADEPTSGSPGAEADREQAEKA
ncbi:MAG TPA: hypothetical protein VGM17_02045 [Rhizomicrobium sp.]|jgi:hypothetical protein